MNLITKKNLTFVINAVFFLVLGILIGVEITPNTVDVLKPLRSPQSTYKLINPLIGFDVSENQNFPEFTDIQKEIQNLLEREKLQNKIATAGIYARTLDNGHWFGINENEGYDPASLFKVPVMMAYFKMAETKPEILNNQVIFTKSESLISSGLIESTSSLEINKKYKIEDLIETMIIKSDNGALNALIDNVELNYLKEVFNDLGIQTPDQGNYKISPKLYAIFFRRLRNSTFLNREFSEKALEILNRVEFKDGISNGVPNGITIAHKFGERGVRNNGNLIGVELHDCGIVYLSKNTYLICIMTGGNNINDLENIISNISSIIYTKISSW